MTPRTRAIFFNSPSNPTGWTADRDTLKAVLELSRKHGLWIIADEIYSLFHYGGTRAPSFMNIMDDEDRILFVNTFSKNWAMTGWRIGWLRVHPSLQQTFENLIQYSTSGVAQFMQRGGVAALEHGDAFLASQIERAQQARDIVCGILGQTGRARIDVPQGAFYLFFSVDGITDSYGAAFEIVEQSQCRSCARHCIRRRWRSLFQAVLPQASRSGRGSGVTPCRLDKQPLNKDRRTGRQPPDCGTRSETILSLSATTGLSPVS